MKVKLQKKTKKQKNANDRCLIFVCEFLVMKGS